MVIVVGTQPSDSNAVFAYLRAACEIEIAHYLLHLLLGDASTYTLLLHSIVQVCAGS
jgi:hypothetical protein